jgi:CRP-like cAMP-binding protein
MLNELLENSPVFACLESSDRDRVIRSANPQIYKKGQWITHLGSEWPYLFIVEKGTIQALKESPEGRSLIVAEISSGELFWGISFFISGAQMPVALVAKDESQLYLWEERDLKPLILKNGGMSWELCLMMIRKMQYASEMLNGFVFQPTTGRLAKVLLEHYGSSEGDFVTRDLTLDEMAARIGSTREMVCRHLYHFADQGVIQINRTEIKINDLEYLKEITGS